MSEKEMIKRTCSVCGAEIEIIVYDDGSYQGGHFFGEVAVPEKDPDGEYVDVDDGSTDMDVVEWTGEKKSFEYWECDECYHAEPEI